VTHDPLAASLALWLDHRLPLPAVADQDGDARLFGLHVLDRDEMLASPAESVRVDGAVRFVAVAEGEPYWLAADVARLAIVHYEALALVTGGWAAPLDGEGGVVAETAPSRHPDRYRVRVTTVALDSGALGSALRRTIDAPAESAGCGARRLPPGPDTGPGLVTAPGPMTGPLAEVFARSCTVRTRPIIGRWDRPPAA
jgi:hypothetical protein